MATILKKPKLKKEVYLLKIVLLEELKKEDIKLPEAKVENIAGRIYDRIKETTTSEIKQLKEEEKNLKDKIGNLTEELNELNLQKEKLINENEKLTQNLENNKIILSEKEKALNEIINKIRNKENELKESIEKIYRETYDKAYKEGKEKGVEEAKETTLAQLSFINEIIDITKQEIENILNNTREERERILASTENEIVKLVMEVAKKIVKSELSQNKNIIIQAVKAALKKVIDRDKVRIIVNPNDLKTLNSYKDEIAQLIEGVKIFEITSLNSITPGGCIIETNLGNIDATIERAEKEIEKELRV